MLLLLFRRSRFSIYVCFGCLIAAYHPAYGQKDTMYPILEDGLFGFINSSGEVIIEPKYDGAKMSSEGLAAVRLGYSWGFVDLQDSVRIAPQFSSVFPFSDGIARVQSGQYWTFIDRNGERITDEYFMSALDFSSGLAPVRVRPGTVAGLEPKWGFIDREGEMVVPDRFVRALPFSDGMAAAEVTRKVIVISINTRWPIFTIS